jgi:glycosyltransferase involved in cell wall biosynthesis
MKVLVYAERIAPSIGGLQRFVDFERRQLLQYGHEVALVTFESADASVKDPPGVVRLGHPGRLLGSSTNAVAFLSAVHRFSPDVVHLHGPGILERLAIPLLHLEAYPVVATFHADFGRSIGRALQSLTDGISYSIADLVLVQTQRDFEVLRHRGVPPDHLQLFRWNGVSRSRLTDPRAGHFEDAPSSDFLFVGTLDRSHGYKGLDQLLSFVRAARFTPDLAGVGFVVIGGGELLDAYRLSAQRDGLTTVRFLGQISDEELAAQYERAAGLIVPATSSGEGFSMVALEALASGLPVIVSRHAGISELIGAYNAGAVVDFRDPSSVLHAIRTVREEKGYRRAAQEAGIRMLRAEGLILEDSMKQFVSILERVARSHLRDAPGPRPT